MSDVTMQMNARPDPLVKSCRGVVLPRSVVSITDVNLQEKYAATHNLLISEHHVSFFFHYSYNGCIRYDAYEMITFFFTK